MSIDETIQQIPPPGQRMIRFCGDTQVFELRLSRPAAGAAWIRTNIGHGNIARREIVQEVDRRQPPLGKDWFDIPMQRVSDQHFRICLPLIEVGHFEAKCYFLADLTTTPVWPPGSNTVLNVAPADTCCANIIYNAFVRQFGANKSGGFQPPISSDRLQVLDQIGYAVIPPSGKFRDLIQQLDFIINTLGCRIIQLLPIHPTPTTYGRMGRYGSPYAALSFRAVDPALAVFDPKATPLEQFAELIDAVHARGAKLHIDIAINHTGWAASLHESHPHWLSRDTQGQIEVPGAWGVRWEDLTRLDYSHKDLWQYMADVFLTWCRRGVDGFRCDAGYMIPTPAWRYIIAKVRDQFPDTVFNLEGLGGKLSVTRDLLNHADFNWAYSELFQNYDRRQIESYLPGANEIAEQDGLLIHYAETHDNPRLASRSHAYARMRTALCALFSPQGGFGYANGVEWYATEKIDVHDAASLNWGAEPNQVDHLQRLGVLLREHPAFTDRTDLHLIQQNDPNHLVLRRRHRPSGRQLIVVVNLELDHSVEGGWRIADAGGNGPPYWDLLSGSPVNGIVTETDYRLTLAPAQVLCLTGDHEEVDRIHAGHSGFDTPPARIVEQRYRAKALEIYCHFAGTKDVGNLDMAAAVSSLRADPVEFCRSMNPQGEESRTIAWQWPRDLHRTVMVPPGHILLVAAENAFAVRLIDENHTVGFQFALPDADGAYFALVTNLPAPGKQPKWVEINLSVYHGDPDRYGRVEHKAKVCLLARPDTIEVQKRFMAPDLQSRSLLTLGTNGRGGMMRAHASWGRLTSRYDALLAANRHPDFPEDRWVLLARCRGWVVFQGYSQEIGDDCMHAFYDAEGSAAAWEFHVPTGQGQYVILSAHLHMVSGRNGVILKFHRHPAENDPDILPDDAPIELILRPDMESRNFHHTTKAFAGPENEWPAAIDVRKDGYVFFLDDHDQLTTILSRGEFVWEPEWQYMVHRPLDAERQLDPDSDLYSPGYFKTNLGGNQHTLLSAFCGPIRSDPTAATELMPTDAFQPPRASVALAESLTTALDHYLVRRHGFESVIAGYPWFLDWGRDSLIFARGLIATGRFASARAVLTLFGQFESNGTLPNMIHGQNAGNRDTSDAPLWFVVACAELVAAEKHPAFLDEVCRGRSIRDILYSIGQAYRHGTENGITMDTQSGLIFSPAHYTWMDTNHPAGTPRQGYPIEIQALWYAALSFLAAIDNGSQQGAWQATAQLVKSSVQDLFVRNNSEYLSDCLHGASGVPAGQARCDDALRPNQLLAITLGVFDDMRQCRRILDACSELLVPGGIRSLADRPLAFPLEIRHNGRLLNDPHRPYQGVYRGDEDTARKPAYHNGTAWTWLYPSFCEAWVKVYGPAAVPTALAWLGIAAEMMGCGCVGHVPEIMDGNAPHTCRGCDAQAWGASEYLRVWRKLSEGLSI